MNVAKVNDMESMFQGATSFNQALCWNTTSVIVSNDFSTDSNATLLPYTLHAPNLPKGSN
jgi:hypothetical protein